MYVPYKETFFPSFIHFEIMADAAGGGTCGGSSGQPGMYDKIDIKTHYHTHTDMYIYTYIYFPAWSCNDCSKPLTTIQQFFTYLDH